MQQLSLISQAEALTTGRVENDYYPTPDGLVQSLLTQVSIEGTVLECCAGHGAISRFFPGCLTNEPFPQPSLVPDFQLDATKRASWEQFGAVDWAVTNPPFSGAAEILPLAFQHAKKGAAFLLRLTYSEPCDDRAEWLQQHADRQILYLPVSPRPQFKPGSKRDSATVAWFVWRKDWSWKRLGIPTPFAYDPHWKARASLREVAA